MTLRHKLSATEQALSNALNMLAQIAGGRTFTTGEFNSRVVEMEQALEPMLTEANAYHRFANRMVGVR